MFLSRTLDLHGWFNENFSSCSRRLHCQFRQSAKRSAEKHRGPLRSRALARLTYSSILLTGLDPGSVAFSTRGAELPPGFVAETLVTNLTAATAIAPASDGRVFIAQQTGELLVWKEGQLLTTLRSPCA
jgi:hypothetical protein